MGFGPKTGRKDRFRHMRFGNKGLMSVPKHRFMAGTVFRTWNDAGEMMLLHLSMRPRKA